MILHITNKSTPSQATLWTIEMNTAVSGHNGAILGLKKRRIERDRSSKHKWNFVSLDHTFGGSWAPNGLGDMNYLKDLFHVEGNPDITDANKVDADGKLTYNTISKYFR